MLLSTYRCQNRSGLFIECGIIQLCSAGFLYEKKVKMNKQKIYDCLPIFFQNIACSVEGYKLKKQRFDKAFFSHLQAYLTRDSWSYEERCRYRDRRLHDIIKHAYYTVPYYSDLFNSLKLKPNDFKTIEDLASLPILTKEDVRNAGEALLSTSVKKEDLIKVSTGGSTGASLELLYTIDLIQEQVTLWLKYRIKLYITLDTRYADFGSRTIVPISQIKPPFWRIS